MDANWNERNRWVWRMALLIVIGHTFLFAIQIPQVYLYNIQNPDAVVGSVWVSIARLAWGVYLWALIAPFVLWMGYRFPIKRDRLWRNLTIHFVFGIVTGVVQHYGYNYGLRILDLTTEESFQSSLSNFANMFNFISSSIVRYVAVVGIQQAYLQFRESQDRAFRLQQAELEVLKMQLHPHFFFNTLNAISALMYRSPKEADRMITRLGDMFRSALKTNKATEVSLKDELELLEAFLQIHQTLMGKRLRVEWEIASDTLDAAVPNLILQPLAENAIQHGLAQLEQGGEITVGARRNDGRLILEMSDTGPGFKPTTAKEQWGIGLSNVRARLETLYGYQQSLSISERTGGGVTLRIEIPWRELSTEKNEYQDNHR